MSINCNPLRWGGLALAGVGVVGIALNDYAKTLDPLSEDKFDTFVLQTTATASTAYSVVGQVQDTITGHVFQVVDTRLDHRASAPLTNVSSGGDLPG